MDKLMISVLGSEQVELDIEPESVIVMPDRFLARTKDGTVSISLSERLEHPIIEKLRTCQDNSKHTIVGEVPEAQYIQVLRHALGSGRNSKRKDASQRQGAPAPKEPSPPCDP